jgi:hypothetical protein
MLSAMGACRPLEQFMDLILTTLAKFHASIGTVSLDEWIYTGMLAWLLGWLA